MLEKERIINLKITKEDLRNVAPFIGIAVPYILWLAGKLSWKPAAILELTSGCAGVADRCIRGIQRLERRGQKSDSKENSLPGRR